MDLSEYDVERPLAVSERFTIGHITRLDPFRDDPYMNDDADAPTAVLSDVCLISVGCILSVIPILILDGVVRYAISEGSR